MSGERDLVDNQTIAGPLSDFMSYNGPPIWISAYTTCQLIGVLWDTAKQEFRCSYVRTEEPLSVNPTFSDTIRDTANLQVQTTQNARSAASGKRYDRERAFLFAAGFVEAENRARLDDLEMIPSLTDISTPAAAGDLKLQLVDSSGAQLAEFSFEVHTAHLDPGQAVPLKVVVPFEDKKNETAKIVVRKGESILGERAVPSAYPQVKLLPLAVSGGAITGRHAISWTGSGPAGWPLSYSLFYSADEGKTWWPVHVGIKQTKADVDFDTLPGSGKPLLKVRASNGGKSAESTLAVAVPVPRKPPQVTIIQPLEGTILDARLPQLLSGEGLSWDEGVLADGSLFSWKSDRVGELGSGHWTVTQKLQPGAHAITLTVRDAAGPVRECDCTCHGP